MAAESDSSQPYVFLSYTTPDRARVLALADRLEAAGIGVWVDRRDIVGGSSWDTSIVDAISRCTVFALTCSPASLASPNVQQEVRLAWEEQRPILPLLLEQVDIPRELRYPLAGRQWIELPDGPDELWLPAVLRALEGLGVVPGRPRPAAVPAGMAAAVSATNLPAPLTSFIGREQELEDITALLGAQRLLTLTGPGGTGKTRLVLAAAERVQGAFPDGVWFVDLSPVTDPAFVLVVLAKVLNVRESQERPLADAVAAYLRSKRLLIVIDNFEQVVEAAPLLRDLLAAAPGVQLLVTSRVLLRVQGEHAYAVAPLPLPEADHKGEAETVAVLAANPAVQLFVARTQAVRPDFALTADNTAAVVAICSALDGLPLALELAAARMKLLTAPALLGRLTQRLQLLTSGERGAPQRQQTLRGAIQWSWELLTEAERVLFRRLGVFAGGFTLEAVEAVCAGAGDLGVDVLDGLTSLVEKSLVQQAQAAGEPRFSLLATLREFALERLAETGEGEVLAQRHAGYFVTLAETAGDALRGPEWAIWQPRLEAEHLNLRAVHSWAIAHRDADTALRLVGALAWWLYAHSGEDIASGRAWAEEALALQGADAPTAGRAAALATLGLLLFAAADYRGARASLQEAATLLRAWERRRDLVIALVAIALTYPSTSRAAAVALEEALALAEETDDPYLRAHVLTAQAVNAWRRGEYERARAGLETSIAIAERVTEPFLLDLSWRTLAEVATDQADPQAGAYIARVLAHARGVALGHQLIEALALTSLHALLAGRLDEAVANAAEGLQLAEASGARIAGDVWCVEVLVCTRTARGQLLEQAARLLGAAAGVHEVAHTPGLHRLAVLVEQTVEALRTALGEAAFTQAYEAGRNLTRDEAIAEAVALAAAGDAHHAGTAS